MAWENVIGGNATLGEGATCGLANPALFANENPTGNPGSGQYIPDASVLSTFVLGDLQINANPTRTITLAVGNVQTTYYSSITPPGGAFKIIGGYSETLSCSPNATYWEGDKPYLVCGIDEENHLGKVGLLFKYQSSAPGGFTDWVCYWTQNAENSQMYAWIKANILPLITYQWSSVPSISGKKGTLSLTQILNINDGEPVEDVTKKSNLDFSKKTKVNTLINSAYEPTYSEDETKATVSYDIPESDYQYTKLVYKKKKIPKSVSDGDAIDLNADATEIVVNNLDENSKYYFKIFTDKTQSNSYKYSTGSNPLPEGKWQETVSTCKATDDSLSMSFTEDIEQWKINQSGATNEWVWLSSLGGYNLTTCSVDAETALNNLNLITDSTLNAGNHPARYYSTVKEHFDKTWNWDSASFVHIQQNGTGYIGWDFRFTAQFFGNFNMQYTTTEVCYGGDFMIAVNHYTMQAVFVWLRWSHHDGNPMALAKTKSSESNTLYYCITKFIN